MSISSKESDYKYFDVDSINHPGIDASFHLAGGVVSPVNSAPVQKKSILTERELAKHNKAYEQQTLRKTEEKYERLRQKEQKLLERVEGRCGQLKQEFEAKMKQLEEHLQKAEKEFIQSRADIERLCTMQKTYIDKEIQTDLSCKDFRTIQRQN